MVEASASPVEREPWSIPWTAQEIEALEERQSLSYVPPYTCNGGNPDWRSHHEGHIKLVPKPEGFTCPVCGRVQTWI